MSEIFTEGAGSSRPLYTVHAFSNLPEYVPSRGGVYIIEDMTEAQA